MLLLDELADSEKPVRRSSSLKSKGSSALAEAAPEKTANTSLHMLLSLSSLLAEAIILASPGIEEQGDLSCFRGAVGVGIAKVARAG